ncbi:MAG: exonuclease domain-containing protein [bacterium]|nr:exonuclease domain-containing protein [bacterium]
MTESQNINSPDQDPVEKQVRKTSDFSRFVAIDLETTGLNPAEGEIIELGAVRFVNREEREIFRVLVKPEHGLPERNRRLTGIEPSMLDHASDPKSALQNFVEFIGDDLLVSHNAPFDTSFLEHHLKKAGLELFDNPALCTLHLAAIINPEAASLQLGNLANIWKIEVIDKHRALQDARMAGRLFVKLVDEIAEWSRCFIAHLASYRGKSVDPIFDLFDLMLKDNPVDSDTFDLGREIIHRLENPGMDTPLPLIKLPAGVKPPAITVDKELSGEIIKAFKRSDVTLIDDLRPGTAPSSLSIPIGAKNSPKFVVAIPDENYLPLILGEDNGVDGYAEPDGAFFLGSRSDYVCTQNAFESDGRPLGWLELSPFERVVLARWLAGTHTGRIARVNWWLLNNFSGLKGHLNILGISSAECDNPGVENSGNSFVELARSKASNAGRVIVTQKHICMRNTGDNSQGRLLDTFDTCIIENASQLIDAARETESYNIELDAMIRRLKALAYFHRDDSTGFLISINKALDQFKDLTSTCRDTISEIRNTQQSESTRPIYVGGDTWDDEEFSELAGALDLAWNGLSKAIQEIEENPGIDASNKSIVKILRNAAETIKVFRKSPSGWAASIEGVPVRKPKRVTLKVVPVDVGHIIKRMLDESKSGVVAVDRHLRYGDSFEQFKQQWNLIADYPVSEIVLEDSSLVLPELYIPEDVTSPTARSGRKYHWEKYMERTANLLKMVAETLGGRTIAAFSAHHELRRVRELLDKNPPSDCIVLAQYMDGTKSSLVREYLTNPKTLLLGGRNFLDGVDLRPAGFTVLVMVKLPFASPEEPVHRAALDEIESHGGDGMETYLVPLAVETSNRWIDSLIAGPIPDNADPGKPPGAVILLDPRAVRNEWGESFVNSLNASPVYRMPFIEIRKRLADLKGR